MKDWPDWIKRDEKLNRFLLKEVEELRKVEIGARFEQDARVNRVLEQLEESLSAAHKNIQLLFELAPFPLVGTIQNPEVEKEREALLKAACESFEGSDYSAAVEVGIDFEQFQWALAGAEYKLREFRLQHPGPKKGRRQTDDGKRYLAWKAIQLSKSLTRAGLDKERCEEALDCVFHAAGHDVPSESTLKRTKRIAGMTRSLLAKGHK